MTQNIRTRKSWNIWRILCFVFVPLLLGIGILLQGFALNGLREVRMLERLPLSSIEATIPGAAHVEGDARAAQGMQLLTSKWTSTSCLWYHAIKEVEKRDSDGNKSWSTVFKETKRLPFNLEDDTAIAAISGTGEVDFDIARTWRNRNGKERFTEWRIDPGDHLHIVGAVTLTDGAHVIQFNTPGEFVPIISKEPIAQARAGRALGITLLIIGSLFLVSAACVCFSLAIRQHNALGFALTIGTVETAFLLIGGVLMITTDLRAAHDALEQQELAARAIVTEAFAAKNIEWNNEWSDGAIFEQFTIDHPDATPINAIRRNLATRAVRVEEVRGRFPQNLIALTNSLPAPLVVVDDTERATLEAATPPDATPFFIGPLIITVLAAVLGTIGLLVALGKIKLKRLIENVPTTNAADAEIGIIELAGTVALAPETKALVGPLTSEPCVWFHYLVQEWHGSGKHRTLVTIEEQQEQQIFLCSDQSGSIPIAAEKARIISGRSTVKGTGIRIYTETSLQPDDPLYVLGSAELDPATGESLRVERDPTKLPYIISNLPENELKAREVVSAFWLLAIAIACTAALVLGLLLFGGRVAAIDQLLAAVASVGMLALIVLLIMYNDLVFLRQRIRLAHSNIDVALRKRHDLLSQLEPVAREAMKYEKTTQTHLAALRSGETSDQALDSLLALRESMPELRANETIELFFHNIVMLENEISARRDGYNAAVERYRSRIHAFPELIIAKTFGFKNEELMSFTGQIRHVPKINFPSEPAAEDE